jgi:hypothetical protein
MVYKVYKVRGKKRFGPYFYMTLRNGKKTKALYLGTEKRNALKMEKDISAFRKRQRRNGKPGRLSGNVALAPAINAASLSLVITVSIFFVLLAGLMSFPLFGLANNADSLTSFVGLDEVSGLQVTEEDLSSELKRIIISGPDDPAYQNILAHTTLSTEMEESKIKLYNIVDGERVLTDFTAYDMNGNSLIDYIEWVVPHLSTQTYELVIEISKAEHLDSNKLFIENVYDSVRERDDRWTTIPEGDYLRVTFEQMLDRTRDITIYARSSSTGNISTGNTATISVEVYEKGSDVKIADFGAIDEDRKYMILLTALNSTQDVFDLRSVGGDVEFDWVVDPKQVTENATEDSYVREDNPGNNYGNANNFWVGESSGLFSESFIKFNNVPEFTVIYEAKLRLYYNSSPINSSNQINISVRRVTEAWNESTVSWSNKPAYNGNYSEVVGVTDNYGWIEWDVTGIVREWANRSYENHGFALVAENESASTVKKFFSMDSANEGLRPNLWINRSNGEVPVVTLIWPKNNTQHGTGRIIFAFNVTDESDIENCSLRINKNNIIDTKYNVTRNQTVKFKITENQERTRSFDILCTDIFGFTGVSEYYSVSTNESLCDIYGKVEDSNNNSINSTFELYQNGELKYNSTTSEDLRYGHALTVEDGNYDINITLHDFIIKSVWFENVSLVSNRIKILDVEDISKSRQRRFAISSTNYTLTNINVTIRNATTNNLYRCANWDFSTQECMDNNWTLFKTGLVVGEDYSINLSSGDYGFIEIIKADHLDENRTFIRDVFEFVKERDDNWTTIPEGEYLRVTFQQILDSTKDITIYARSNTTTSVEIYQKDSYD